MIPEVRQIVKKLKEIKELLPDAVWEVASLAIDSLNRRIGETDGERNDTCDYCDKAGELLDELRAIEIPDTLE